MIGEQQAGRVIDPSALEREWAANICELLAVHAESLADVMRRSPTASSPWLQALAESISSRAGEDFAMAARLRGEYLRPSRPQAPVPLRLV